MDERRNYRIQIGEQVKEDELNATSPLRVVVIECNAATTLLSLCTDQSGLIGLLRHLHGQGHILLSVWSSPQIMDTEDVNYTSRGRE